MNYSFGTQNTVLETGFPARFSQNLLGIKRQTVGVKFYISVFIALQNEGLFSRFSNRHPVV